VCSTHFFECPDLSDHRLCNFPDCGNRTDYFPCSQEEVCIHESLVCDGHKQCEDGSDEEHCDICPRVNSKLQKSKTFRCFHRYTMLPICANPCDGLDDLCLDYSDEQCQGVPTWLSMTSVVVAILSFTLITKLLHVAIGHCRSKESKVSMKHVTRPLDRVYMSSINRKINMIEYKLLKEKEGFACALANCLAYFQYTSNIATAHAMSLYYFNLEKECNDNSSNMTDIFYFNVVGTDETASRLYDFVENSIGLRIENFVLCNTPSWMLIPWERNIFVNLFTFLKYLKKIMLHYFDLLKDFILLGKIWIIILGSNSSILFQSNTTFPVIIFWVTFAAIAMSELTNILTLLHSDAFPHWNRRQKLTSCICVPLMPAFVYYKELEQNFKKASVLQIMYKKRDNLDNVLHRYAEKDLQESRTKLHALKILRTQFKSNENVVEHFVQLIMLLLIILVTKSDTKKVTSLDRIVLDDNETFLVISTIISCVSLLSGQVSHLSAMKGSFLSLTGKCILYAYFLISLSVRVFVIMLCYTSVLGLFSTNQHGKLGSMKVNSEVKNYVYDVTATNKHVSFEKAWDNFTLDGLDVYPMLNYFSLLPPLLFFVHWCVSFFLLSFLYKRNTYSKIKLLLQGLYTILFPPVFADWETIYRHCNGQIPITKCWQKSKIFICIQIAINFIQHISFCVPLMLFKVAIDQRNVDLTDAGFYPLKDELLSNQRVNDLLIAGFSLSFLLPVVQCSFILLYFTKGHPWSRILNANRRVMINPCCNMDKLLF
jgi:hypothetical protein